MLARLAAVLGLSTALLSTASADGAPDARQLHAEATAHYDRGDYVRAAELFAAAFEQSRRTSLLFNVAQAYRRADRCNEAQQFYAKFVEAEPRSQAATLAREYLATPCPKTAEAPTTGATAPTTGAPTTAAPTTTTAQTTGAQTTTAQTTTAQTTTAPAPGSLTTAPASDASAATAPAADAPAADATAPATRVPVPMAPSQRSSDRARTLRIAGLSAGAGGLVALIAGGVVFATSTETTRCVDHCDRDLEDQKFETTRSNSGVSTALLIGGGSVLAAGVGLYVWGHLTRSPAPVEVTPTSGGAMVSRSWTF
ncbi:MAG: tetratricopeptide repeat protein [Kofleriaceae bacterium]